MNKDKNNQPTSNKFRSRRGFIGDLSKVAVISASLPLTPVLAMPKVSEENRLESSEDLFGLSTAPYLQNLTESSVDILCITNAKSHSWIEYGEENIELKTETYSDGFVQANNSLHKIRLSGLKANISHGTSLNPSNLNFKDSIAYRDTDRMLNLLKQEENDIGTIDEKHIRTDK